MGSENVSLPRGILFLHTGLDSFEILDQESISLSISEEREVTQSAKSRTTCNRSFS
jgi:hypothetical protein